MAGGATRDRREYMRQWALNNPERTRELGRKTTLRKYRLDEDDFVELLKAQGGRCAICHGSEPGGRWNQWHVDHDHAAEGIGIMHVRGLVCDLCNRVLGYAKDDAEVLRQAADYLERTNFMATSSELKVVND